MKTLIQSCHCKEVKNEIEDDAWFITPLQCIKCGYTIAIKIEDASGDTRIRNGARERYMRII